MCKALHWRKMSLVTIPFLFLNDFFLPHSAPEAHSGTASPNRLGHQKAQNNLSESILFYFMKCNLTMWVFQGIPQRKTCQRSARSQNPTKNLRRFKRSLKKSVRYTSEVITLRPVWGLHVNYARHQKQVKAQNAICRHFLIQCI